MYSYLSAAAIGQVLHRFKKVHFGDHAKPPKAGQRYTNDQCAEIVTHYEVKLQSIIYEKERAIK